MSKAARTALRVAVIAAVLTVCALGIWRARKGSGPSNLPVAEARQGEFAVLVHCRGSLSAAHSVQLTAPIDIPDLQIVWLAPTGSDIKGGSPVVRFDPAKTQQDLREKSASLEQAQASLDQTIAEGRITADQDRLDLASAQFDCEKARLEASKKAVVSPMEGEKSTVDLGLAEQKVRLQKATAELHSKSTEAKVASQTRLRDEAAAEVQRGKKRLVNLELCSPVNGVVTYLTNRTQGWMNSQPFKVGDHVFAGLEIAEIPELSTLEMQSNLDEVDRGRIASQNDVQVHVDAFPEKRFAAKLRTVSALTEQDFTQWPPTRSFRVFAALVSRDSRLRPGMNGTADIVVTRLSSAIKIPAKALFAARGKPIVYERTKNGFEAHSVEVLARNTDEIAVRGIPAGTSVALIDPREQAGGE